MIEPTENDIDRKVYFECENNAEHGFIIDFDNKFVFVQRTWEGSPIPMKREDLFFEPLPPKPRPPKELIGKGADIEVKTMASVEVWCHCQKKDVSQMQAIGFDEQDDPIFKCPYCKNKITVQVRSVEQ